jgi:small conductance mechanosensitive channel
MSDEISVAQEAWLRFKINLVYLTGALAVLLAGVILAPLLSKRADLALTSSIIRHALWAVVGFVGTEASATFLLRGDNIE